MNPEPVNILLVSDAYPPEIRSASHLMQELAEELRDRGHQVYVATCYPAYNLTAEAQNKNYPPIALEGGIRVLRIRSLPHHKVNFVVRGISQVSLPFIFMREIRRCFRNVKFDAVVVYSPPLPLWRVGQSVQKACGANFVLNVQDIFPQNAMDLGALTNPLLIRFFERMERAAYKAADHVTVHSEGNAKFLLEQGRTHRKKLSVLHNWVSIGKPPGEEPSAIFRKKWGLDGRFIFFFGGVIGPSQGLDLVVEAASRLREIENLAVLLVGDGTRKEHLKALVHEKNLKNVILKPFVSREDYQELLKEVDVGLVSLTSDNKTPVVPGKILGYMAAGLPVLALLNRESDGHQMIQEARCGYTTVSGDAVSAANLMKTFYAEKAHIKEMGMNGYHYASRHFKRGLIVDQLEALCLN